MKGYTRYRTSQSSTDASKELASVETGIYELATGRASALQLDTAEQPSHQSDNQKWALLSLLALIWVACGVAMYMSEGYSAVDSVYGIVQILSTVGYGNILPISQTTKLLTALLVLTSLFIASGCVTVLLDHLLDKQNEVLKGKLMEAESRINASAMEMGATLSMVANPTGTADDGGGDGISFLPLAFRRSISPASAASDADAVEFQSPVKIGPAERSVIVSFVVFAFFVLLGTLFFAIYESCTCGDGPSLVEGCDVDDCEATNGHRKTLVDAFYMSVVTLSTVGFGDETALSWEGKLFSIFWILFGVGSTINFVGDLTDCIHKKAKFAENHKISDELFQTMDQDGNGLLDRVEFLKLQVVMQGLAKPEEIDTMLRQFDLIDRGKDGSISLEEVKEYYR